MTEPMIAAKYGHEALAAEEISTRFGVKLRYYGW